MIGSKEGIVHLALTCVDPGDVVLVLDPGYAPYTIGTILAGGDPVPFTLLSDRGFLPDLEAIPPEVVRRAVLLWLNYPNNPTGVVAVFPFLVAAVGFARRHRILLCHDVPCADVAFDGHRPTSILEVPDAADVSLEFRSLSKTFNTPGWRAGMAVGNPAALVLLSRVESNVDSGIFSPLQEAATRALAVDEAWIAARNAVYKERLGTLLEGADTLGLLAAVP